MANYYQQYDATQHYKITTYTIVPVEVFFDCLGAFFSIHSDAFTAIATIVIAAFTAVLWVSTHGQWKVSNRTLLLQFRPRVIVRNIVINPIVVRGQAGQRDESAMLERGLPVVGQFYIVNVGGTDAAVSELHAEVTWKYYELPMRRPYEGKNGTTLSTPHTLKSGESMPWRFDSVAALDINPFQIRDPQVWGEQRRRLYVLGWVAYADNLGFIRRTAFCRYLDLETGRFTAVKDPDYEHAE